jgi:hypothetical protein
MEMEGVLGLRSRVGGRSIICTERGSSGDDGPEEGRPGRTRFGVQDFHFVG